MLCAVDSHLRVFQLSGRAVRRFTVILKVDVSSHAQFVCTNMLKRQYLRILCKYPLWCTRSTHTSVERFCWNVVIQNGTLSIRLLFLMAFVLLQWPVFPKLQLLRACNLRRLLGQEVLRVEKRCLEESSVLEAAA